MSNEFNIEYVETFTHAKRIIRSKADVFVAVPGTERYLQVVKKDVLAEIEQVTHTRRTEENPDSILDYDGNPTEWRFWPNHGTTGHLYIDGGF